MFLLPNLQIKQNKMHLCNVLTHRNTHMETSITMTANQSILAGSFKKGFMEIRLGEKVEVIKITKKCVFVKKNLMVKSFSKTLFN